jgi:hypothetical protein
MKRAVLFMSIVAAMSLFAARAQSPSPAVIPAAVPAAPTGTQPSAPATVSIPAVQDSGSILAALKSLQEIKAANDEMLRRQEAVLQQLDELQKAAEQMKIFSKRG